MPQCITPRRAGGAGRSISRRNSPTGWRTARSWKATCAARSDLTDLMRAADAAMYHAKASGRGRAEYFTQELADRMADRAQLESDLRGAIRSDRPDARSGCRNVSRQGERAGPGGVFHAGTRRPDGGPRAAGKRPARRDPI